MVEDKNQLLEYTIDTLLKTFNPQNKPIMKKSHFFKMMDILNTRLKNQRIDIKYPSYWYMYGTVTDFDVLDQVISNGFTARYCEGEFIHPPFPCRKVYNIDERQSPIINSTVKLICNKYQYKKDYGDMLKKDSYNLNSPYKFNTIFQDYIKTIESITISKNLTIVPIDELVEPLLDKLLNEFPEDDFPEIVDVYLAWDDTVRLVLDRSENGIRPHYLLELKNKFWELFSKGVRTRHNKYIPNYRVTDWKVQYIQFIPEVNTYIENVRKDILIRHSGYFDGDEDLVKELLEKAYHFGA